MADFYVTSNTSATTNAAFTFTSSGSGSVTLDSSVWVGPREYRQLTLFKRWIASQLVRKDPALPIFFKPSDEVPF